MQLTWFGHSAFRLEYAGTVIMIDPFLANPTFKGDHKAAYAGTQYVLLSHGHGDHIGSTVEICAATGATLIANACVPILLISYGISLYGQRVLGASGRRRDIVLATTLKLVAMPVIAWAVAEFAFGLSPHDILIVTVLAALPTLTDFDIGIMAPIDFSAPNANFIPGFTRIFNTKYFINQIQDTVPVPLSDQPVDVAAAG